MAWRLASRTAYDRVEDILYRERRAVVEYYFPDDADLFLVNLDEYRGIIVGHAALAFLLRDRQLLSNCVEVAIGRRQAQDFEDLLLSYHWIQFISQTPDPPSPAETTVRLFRTKNGRFLKLLLSRTNTPLMPLTDYDTSALMNYVSRWSFGCAYPLLTLQRLGLIPRPWAFTALPPPVTPVQGAGHANGGGVAGGGAR